MHLGTSFLSIPNGNDAASAVFSALIDFGDTQRVESQKRALTGVVFQSKAGCTTSRPSLLPLRCPQQPL